MTELLYNPELNKIIIPIFHRFKFQAIEWNVRNQSQNVEAQFQFGFVDNDILGMLSKLSDNLEIINGDEIISELTKQTLQFNDAESIEIKLQDLQNMDVQSDNPKKGQEKYKSSFKGYNTVFNQKIHDIRLKIKDSSESPQLFSDVQIKLKINEKKLKIKCKADDYTEENQNIIVYEYTFDYLIQDNRMPKKIFEYSNQFNDEFADNQEFFNNQLGYRQLITDQNTIEQQISIFNNPIFEEYYCIYPMLILILFQVCTNFYGNEVERLATLATIQTGYAGLAIVSTMNKMSTNQLTVSDQLYVASFVLILVQTTEIVTISLWNQDYFKSLDAKTSLVDDQLQKASTTIQITIFLVTILQWSIEKQSFNYKKRISMQKHRYIIQETENLDEVDKKQEIKDTPLKIIEKSINLMGEQHLNYTALTFKFFNQLWISSSIFLVSPTRFLVEYTYKDSLKQTFSEQNKQYKKSIEYYEDKLIMEGQIQPIEYKYIKLFNIDINNLLKIDYQWNFQQLDKIKLNKDAKKQLIDNKLESQKENFIKLKDFNNLPIG